MLRGLVEKNGLCRVWMDEDNLGIEIDFGLIVVLLF